MKRKEFEKLLKLLFSIEIVNNYGGKKYKNES